ncbi:25931_t:CDS:2, partial [Racocetra persica]
SLCHWVETLESQKKYFQCTVKNNIWKLSMDWNKKQSKRNLQKLQQLEIDLTSCLR